MKLLDTNIFIYAMGRPNPYKDPCLRIVAALEGSFHGYLTNTEVLQEILHIFARRGEREHGARRVREIMDSVEEVIPIGREEIYVASRLLIQRPQLDARDAIHAAVVQLHGLEGIVSADRGFDVIRGVTRFDPMEMFPNYLG